MTIDDRLELSILLLALYIYMRAYLKSTRVLERASWIIDWVCAMFPTKLRELRNFAELESRSAWTFLERAGMPEWNSLADKLSLINRDRLDNLVPFL